MADKNLEPFEHAIEQIIYEKSVEDAGFAIAYALIQCAAALNNIAGELGAVGCDVNVRATLVQDDE